MLEALVDEKPIRGVLCGSFSILLSAVIALAPVQAAGAAANSALGDSDIGEFYRIDDVAKKEPGVLLRQEPLEEHQS
jgi:hypothetical protein